MTFVDTSKQAHLTADTVKMILKSLRKEAYTFNYHQKYNVSSKKLTVKDILGEQWTSSHLCAPHEEQDLLKKTSFAKTIY